MSESLKEKLLDEMLKTATTSYRIGDLISFFSDTTSAPSTIQDVFDGPDDAGELIGDTLSSLTNEEIKDLFRPILSDVLCKTLGAKNVIIEW